MKLENVVLYNMAAAKYLNLEPYQGFYISDRLELYRIHIYNGLEMWSGHSWVPSNLLDELVLRKLKISYMG